MLYLGRNEYEQSYGYMDNFVDLDNDQLQQALKESLSHNSSLPHQGMMDTGVII